jgi:uncharacterized protein
MVALTLACGIAAVLGFAAHRASVCAVRAVAEVVSSGTAHMLLSIGKSALWVAAVTSGAILLMPSVSGSLIGWPLTGAAVLGGFLFGVGAAVNGACAYSTMARLVDGEGGMLVTLVALAFGVLCCVMLADWHWLEPPIPMRRLASDLTAWPLVPALILASWGIYEAVRLWRLRPVAASFRSLVFARQYRLSSAAMLIGLASAAIFLIYGSASYTMTLQQAIEGLRGVHGFPRTERWILFFAVMTGMLLSTVQRGSFHLDWRPRRLWLRNVLGGLLMGFGVALTPGGNDALVLYAIPTLSWHALPAFLAMLLGIAVGLWGMRAWFGIELRVACRNDLYIIAATEKMNHHPVTMRVDPHNARNAASR